MENQEQTTPLSPNGAAEAGPKLTFQESTVIKKGSRIPLLIAAIFIMTTLALTIALIVVLTRDSTQSNSEEVKAEDVCTTAGCTKAAAMMLESMDLSVDPCDDFYTMSCGGWINKNVIPEDSSSYTTFSSLREAVVVQIKTLLENEVSTDDPKAVEEAKDMYKACMGEDIITAKGTQPLEDLLTKLGGWPIIDSKWNSTAFDLIGVMSKLRLLNNVYMVNMWVSADDKDSTKNILQLDQFSLGMPGRDYYLKDRYAKIRQAYQTFMKETALFLGGNETTVDEDVQAVMDFETYIANISAPREERRDPSVLYNKMTIAQLRTNVSDKFEWLRYINTVFASVNYTFNESSEVVVYAPKFLNLMFEKLSEIPNRVKANYMLWRITIYRLSNLHQSAMDIYNKYRKVLYGIESQTARWKKCAGYVNSFMGFAVGRLFVKEYFNENAKSDALEMIAGVREAFDDRLEGVEWMDETTRGKAKSKSATIAEKIGYPDWILNNTRLNSEYEGILNKVNVSDYFGSELLNRKWKATVNLRKISEPVDRERWTSTPAIVNAYYSASRNQIAFPAGVLQPPFWQQDRPMSMNYGGIGSVIGHEITHGFDDQGRQFDADGNLAEWWSEDVVKAFKDKAKCIIDQYSQYKMTQINRTLNGKLTQGENIADNGGIKQSYQAFLAWQSKHGEGQRLPGLQQYSSKQLFFLAFGQIWCSNWRDQGINNAIETGVHSPGMYRVIGTLSNFEEFSKVFNCPAGSRMNPAKKCSIW